MPYSHLFPIHSLVVALLQVHFMGLQDMNGYTVCFLNITFLILPNLLQFHLASQEAPFLIFPLAEPRCSTLIFLALASVIKGKDPDTILTGTPHHIPLLLSKQVKEFRFYTAFSFPTTCGLVFKEPSRTRQRMLTKSILALEQ